MSIIPEATKQPNYVAVIGEDIRSASLLMRLGSLVERTTEEDLNFHMIHEHLPSAVVMRGLGFRFDAELAAFLGLSLQETADATLKTLEEIREGKELTHSGFYYRERAEDEFGQYPNAVALYLEKYYAHSDRLKAELQTLYELGVATGDRFDTPLDPFDGDSFFQEFRIERF